VTIQQKAVDIVIVPDFTGSKAAVYEQRTLLFLTSWIVNAGRASSFPLHIVCIGEPPPRVLALAKECHASVTVHAPMMINTAHGTTPVPGHGATCNKLRGLEIEGRTGRVLLLDVDVVVLSDPSAVADIDADIAAAPDTFPRIPDDYWRRICNALDIAIPEKAEPTLSQRYSIARPRNFHRTWHDSRTSIISYYNSGVLLLPRDAAVRELWKTDLRRIASIFTTGDRYWRDVILDDQAGLAAAIATLQKQGTPFFPLPEQFNARPYHIFLGACPLEGVKLFHFTQIFSGDYRLRKLMPFLHSIPLSQYKYDLLFRYFELLRANWGRHSEALNFKSIPSVLANIMRLDKKLMGLRNVQRDLLRR
jgi:hypothetical protein